MKSDDGGVPEMAGGRNGGRRAPVKVRHRLMSDSERNGQRESMLGLPHLFVELGNELRATEKRRSNDWAAALISSRRDRKRRLRALGFERGYEGGKCGRREVQGSCRVAWRGNHAEPPRNRTRGHGIWRTGRPTQEEGGRGLHCSGEPRASGKQREGGDHGWAGP